MALCPAAAAAGRSRFPAPPTGRSFPRRHPGISQAPRPGFKKSLQASSRTPIIPTALPPLNPHNGINSVQGPEGQPPLAQGEDSPADAFLIPALPRSRRSSGSNSQRQTSVSASRLPHCKTPTACKPTHSGTPRALLRSGHAQYRGTF